MVIDHVGIVVPDLSMAIDRWIDVFGYNQMTEIIVNTRQQVRVVFLQKEGSVLIKLIEPSEKNSPIYRFASRGGGLHHLCFRCNDVIAETARLNSMGFRILTSPQPGEAFENQNIAFVYAHAMNLNIELIDTNLKAGMLSDKR